MTFAVDTKLHWTDHYVEHGFAVIKRAVGDEFIKPALAEIREVLGHQTLPLKEWTAKNTPTRLPKAANELKVLPTIYDQPGILNMMATMFGTTEAWDGERAFGVFVNPYDENAKAEVNTRGHIDFVNCPVPIFGSGFMMQVSLVKSEPFSGNITIYPGSHKLVQRALVENPDLTYPTHFQDLLECEPFEFVAEPGDLMIFHHLVGHAGNFSHAANRSPRVAIHGQCNTKNWLREIDPAAAGLSPWRRSLAFTGGNYRTRRDEFEWIMEFKKTKKSKAVAAY